MSDESNQTQENNEQVTAGNQPSGRPVRAPVREAPSQPVQTAGQPVNVRRERQENVRREQRAPEEKRGNLGEYIKFGILAVILLGTPLVIALLIPLIFGQIVPTVLGSNLPTETPAIPGDQVVEPDSAGTPAYPAPGEAETGIGGEQQTPAATPAAPDPNSNEVLVHLVRTGDTLESIARRYGVSSADIAVANNIQNPNEIFVGSVLIIPQPTSP